MFYFAYGSNMDPAQMAARCPGALALGPAVLADHRLTFTWDSQRWAGGVGHVEPARGEEVWGVLWEIAPDHERALDRYELVDDGVYTKGIATVWAAGRPTPALIYRAVPVGYRAPSAAYVQALVRGARANGLPDGYVARLETLMPA